jgi:NADPH2:quinone reductase
MKALELQSYSGPSGLEPVEIPDPTADDDRVLIDVEAVGINFPDLLTTKGLYQYKPEVPFVPGCEIAGVVRSAPDGSDWSTGDRVAAFVWQGGYAERATAPLNAIIEIPPDADFATAAAMVVNYHTVHFALRRRGQLRNGETLLVLGAAGGIGTAAVQVGKGLGASVIAGVGSDKQCATATVAGADEVLVVGENFGSRVREIAGGRGVDVVLDPLGDWFFGEAVRALAPEGRILIIGFAAGDIPSIRVNRLLLRNVSAVGVAWGAFLEVDSTLMHTSGAALRTMFEAGTLRPQIGARYRFEEIPSALDRLDRGEIPGKAVVVVNDGGMQPKAAGKAAAKGDVS